MWANNGKHSIYEGVSADHAAKIMNSASVGAAVRDLQHKPAAHPHRYDDEV